MFKIISLFLSVSLSLFIASCGTDSTTEKVKESTTYITMPESTAVAVIFVDSIDTDIDQTGMEFRAKLLQPIVVSGHTLFGENAEVKGVLNKVVESGRLKTSAELIYSLTAIQDKGGSWVNINTYEIRQIKGSHTDREVAMIGGGAIVGGIIGKIIDKEGSTEIGAVAGAAAGAATAAASGKKDIVQSAGTGAVFYTSQPTQIALK